MQWMTMTFVVPCHALHAPQHAAPLLFVLLNHGNAFLHPSSLSRLYITGTGKSRYAGFCLELPTPRWIADQGLRAPSSYTDSVNSYNQYIQSQSMKSHGALEL